MPQGCRWGWWISASLACGCGLAGEAELLRPEGGTVQPPDALHLRKYLQPTVSLSLFEQRRLELKLLARRRLDW